MEKRELNAINFYNEFMDCIRQGVENKGDWVESKERYRNNFTYYINKGLMPKCFEKFASGCSYEYYRIDVLGWEQLKSSVEVICKEVEMTPYLWDLRIAFEHENESTDWFDEVIKLLYIDSPLKVVVGYNDYNKRFIDENKESDKSKLDALCLILSKLNRIKDLLSKNEFLIILGNCGDGFAEKEGAEYFGYKGYRLYIEEGKVKYKNIEE